MPEFDDQDQPIEDGIRRYARSADAPADHRAIAVRAMATPVRGRTTWQIAGGIVTVAAAAVVVAVLAVNALRPPSVPADRGESVADGPGRQRESPNAAPSAPPSCRATAAPSSAGPNPTQTPIATAAPGATAAPPSPRRPRPPQRPLPPRVLPFPGRSRRSPSRSCRRTRDSYSVGALRHHLVPGRRAHARRGSDMVAPSGRAEDIGCQQPIWRPDGTGGVRAIRFADPRARLAVRPRAVGDCRRRRDVVEGRAREWGWARERSRDRRRPGARGRVPRLEPTFRIVLGGRLRRLGRQRDRIAGRRRPCAVGPAGAVTRCRLGPAERPHRRQRGAPCQGRLEAGRRSVPMSSVPPTSPRQRRSRS